MPPTHHLGPELLASGLTRFTLWAPSQRRVQIRFPKSDRSLAMSRDERGYHTVTTEAPAGTRYAFMLEDGRLRPDPASRSQPDGVHAPSMVVDRDRPRSGFINRPLSEHVIYELHVGTFTPEGTFEAIIPRLDDLRRLGITAIELMPIAQFPGSRNWGYDGVLPFAAQWSYGGIAGLRRLVDACHERGIACFLDVVYNHMGPEGNYLAEFGPYFTDRYKTPWGAALNFDGRDSDEVREYFIQSSLHWTVACGIDGLRVDAVHAIVDHTATPFIQELTERNHAAARVRDRTIHVIAESCDNDPRLVREPPAGIGMDGCWNDDFHHALRSAITGERRGYYAAYGEPGQIARCLQDRFVFTGQFSSGFGRRHGSPAGDVPHGRYIAFTQNHDQVGNRPLGDRLDVTAGLDGARVAAAMMLLSPFTPMLWMGEEFGESAPFLYFVSHSDRDLIEAVRKGRAAEFAEFQAGQPLPDPQAEETFLRSKIRWGLRDHPPHAAMLAYYSELLRLRARLRLWEIAPEVRSQASGPVVAVWYGAASPVILLANTSAEDATTSAAQFPGMTGTNRILLNSDDARWAGTGRRLDWAQDRRDALTVPPRTAVVLGSQEPA